MYYIENSIAKINGSKGIYDGKINNPSVRYGRNSVNNMQKYLQEYTTEPPCENYPDFSNVSMNSEEFEQKMTELKERVEKTDKWLENLPPLEFEQRYMPNGKFDKMALMGAAYEELNKQTEIKTSDLTAMMQEAYGEQVSAEALDLDKNGKIDLAEYSTSILLSDIMSTNKSQMSLKDIDGIITDKGQDAMLPYANKKNYDIANKTYQALYEGYNLKQAQKEFISNPNNIV